MAHRCNIIPVAQSFTSVHSSEQVEDPVCKKMLKKNDVKHVLFQQDLSHYFCSKECLLKYTQPPTQQLNLAG